MKLSTKIERNAINNPLLNNYSLNYVCNIAKEVEALEQQIEELKANSLKACASVYKDNTLLQDESEQLKQQIELMRKVLSDASDYLDISKETSIGHGSILHREFKEFKQEKENDTKKTNRTK